MIGSTFFFLPPFDSRGQHSGRWQKLGLGSRITHRGSSSFPSLDFGPFSKCGIGDFPAVLVSERGFGKPGSELRDVQTSEETQIRWEFRVLRFEQGPKSSLALSPNAAQLAGLRVDPRSAQANSWLKVLQSPSICPKVVQTNWFPALNAESPPELKKCRFGGIMM